jgi:hypothetical protein
MELTLTIGGASYKVDALNAHDISVPVRFDGSSLQAFGAPTARRKPWTAEGFTGSVSQGGSCNCDVLEFIPHTSGTHTESVGHLSTALLPINELITESLIPATLITISPSEAGSESYDPTLNPEDRVITEHALSAALSKVNEAFLAALIIRTGNELHRSAWHSSFTRRHALHRPPTRRRKTQQSPHFLEREAGRRTSPIAQNHHRTDFGKTHHP